MSSQEARLEAEKKGVYDLIASIWTYYGDYHDRKEQIAYAATVLYLTAATALIASTGAFWKDYPPRHFAGFALLLFLTAFGVLWFVYWQLDRRRWAADMGSACVTTLAGWSPGSLTEADLQPEALSPPAGSATRGSVKYPAIVVKAFQQNVADHLWPWLPRELALGLMILWTVAAGCRIWNEWEGVMTDVNWWSTSGLILDTLGSIGIAFSAGWFSRGITVTQPWEASSAVRWALRVSVVVFVLGFLLQILGQFK